jgi:hypothetical protein
MPISSSTNAKRAALGCLSFFLGAGVGVAVTLLSQGMLVLILMFAGLANVPGAPTSGGVDLAIAVAAPLVIVVIGVVFALFILRRRGVPLVLGLCLGASLASVGGGLSMRHLLLGTPIPRIGGTVIRADGDRAAKQGDVRLELRLLDGSVASLHIPAGATRWYGGYAPSSEPSCDAPFDTGGWVEAEVSLKELGGAFRAGTAYLCAIEREWSNVPARRPETWKEASPNALIVQAGERFNSTRYAEALELFERSLKKDPDSAVAYYGTALCLSHLDRPKEAREALARAARLAPDNLEILYWYANSLAGSDNERAASVFEGLVAKEPQNSRSLAGLGNALYNVGRYEEAGKAFDRANQLCPSCLSDTEKYVRRDCQRLLTIKAYHPGFLSILGL